MNVLKSTLKVIVVLFVFSALMAAIYLIFGSMDSANKAIIWIEIVKILLQLGVIVVLGALIKSMLESFERTRNDNKAIHDYREELIKEIRLQYEATKSAQSILRASGLTDAFSPNTLNDNQVADYKVSIKNLNESKLGLEGLEFEIEKFPTAFKKSEELKESIKMMKSYLSEINSEYESHWSKLSTDATQVLFESLEQLRGFTKENDSKFESNFNKPYKLSVGYMRQELLPFGVAKAK